MPSHRTLAIATALGFLSSASLGSSPIGFYWMPDYEISWDVSDTGTVLALYGHVVDRYDVLWTPGVLSLPINTIGGERISGDGHTVVGRDGGGPFRWSQSTNQTIRIPNPLGGSNTHCTGVSYDGNVVVGYDDHFHAFRWTAQTGSVIISDGFAYDVTPDGNTVIGVRDQYRSPLLYNVNTGIQQIPRFGVHLNTVFQRISADGSVIVGEGQGGPTPGRAFRWTQAGGYQSLGELPPLENTIDDRFYAHAVSRDGFFIGGSHAGQQAWIWDPIHGMRDLKTVLVNDYGFDGLDDWTLYDVESMSPDGSMIVGRGTIANTGFQQFAFVAVIPCRSDLNRDGAVDFFDYLDFIAAFSSGEASAEFNGDSTIDFFDYLDFVAVFASGC